MTAQPCPHCGTPTVSTLRKSFLGPITSTTCRSCGKRISTAWRSALVIMLPFLVVVLIRDAVVPKVGVTVYWIVLLAVAAASLVVWDRRVPLIRR